MLAYGYEGRLVAGLIKPQGQRCIGFAAVARAVGFQPPADCLRMAPSFPRPMDNLDPLEGK